MNRVDRLLGMLTYLQSKRYVTAEELAERFDKSVRTVYRDVRALCEQGIPITFEPHRGYCIVSGFFLPPVSFTTEEANALLLLENLVQGMTDSSTKEHYSSALTKVRSVLHRQQRDVAETTEQTIRVQLPERLRPGVDHLSTLQLAIAQKLVMSMDYMNSKEETSQRSIEPIGLIFYAFSWHLIAWCRLREEYRDFKVSRIRQVSASGDVYTREHISLNEYMKYLPVEW